MRVSGGRGVASLIYVVSRAAHAVRRQHLPFNHPNHICTSSYFCFPQAAHAVCRQHLPLAHPHIRTRLVVGKQRSRGHPNHTCISRSRFPPGCARCASTTSRALPRAWSSSPTCLTASAATCCSKSARTRRPCSGARRSWAPAACATRAAAVAASLAAVPVSAAVLGGSRSSVASWARHRERRWVAEW